jgi:hypothetical protein
MKPDCTITWASGATLISAGFRAYCNSLVRSGFDGERIIFTSGLVPDSVRDFLRENLFRVIECGPNGASKIMYRRFMEFSKFLRENRGAYRYVIATDARDVVFNFDPVLAIERLACGTPECVILSSEGFEHKDHEWNNADHHRFQDTYAAAYRLPFADHPVLNGGTHIGTQELIADHFLTLGLMDRYGTPISDDQAYGNFIHLHRRGDPRFVVADPRTDKLVLTGEALKQGLIHAAPAGYAIFHQWDRTEHQAEILRRFA